MKLGVNFPDPLVTYIREQAQMRFHGNVSGYLQDLVEKDRSKAPARTAALAQLSPEQREALGIRIATEEMAPTSA